jgi:hypothetical protein
MTFTCIHESHRRENLEFKTIKKIKVIDAPVVEISRHLLGKY